MSVNIPSGTSVSSGRRPGRPPLISRTDIQEAALRIVDEDGLDALTMRRLGAVLGVDPMATYRHFPNKAALFDGVVEQLLSQVDIPEPGDDWWVSFSGLVRALRSACSAHPNVVPLFATRPPTATGAFELVEAGVSVLLSAGLSPERAIDGVDMAARLVIGHVLAESGRPPEGVSGGEVEHMQAQDRLPAERFPALAAVGRARIAHDPERLFELALDGLRRALRDADVVEA